MGWGDAALNFICATKPNILNFQHERRQFKASTFHDGHYSSMISKKTIFQMRQLCPFSRGEPCIGFSEIPYCIINQSTAVKRRRHLRHFESRLHGAAYLQCGRVPPEDLSASISPAHIYKIFEIYTDLQIGSSRFLDIYL